MLTRVTEMVTQVMDANGWVLDDFISIIFTATTDLVSEFPAYAARMLGFTDVPLICTRELEIEGSMPRVVRMMAHVDTDLPRADITHVYLHGAGLLGTSLGLALRRRNVEVLLTDRHPEHVRTATGLGAGREYAGQRPGL